MKEIARFYFRDEDDLIKKISFNFKTFIDQSGYSDFDLFD